MNQWINPFKPQSAIGNRQSSIAIPLSPWFPICNRQSSIFNRHSPASLVSNLQSAILNLQSLFSCLLLLGTPPNPKSSIQNRPGPALPIRNPKPRGPSFVPRAFGKPCPHRGRGHAYRSRPGNPAGLIPDTCWNPQSLWVQTIPTAHRSAAAGKLCAGQSGEIQTVNAASAFRIHLSVPALLC
jgi:hypothetical protein